LNIIQAHCCRQLEL